jgi:N6-adenosine-specific RNA methylase IME4
MKNKKFNIIAADCPWQFSDKLKMSKVKRGSEANYNCMSTKDICNLDLPPIADDALLFLWRVASMQKDALEVMNSWGFKLKSEIIWIKTTNNDNKLAFGMGRYTRHCHETCLIGVRGRGIKLVKDHSIRSVFFAPREEHSKKPDKFFEIVEQMTNKEGSYLELFSRKERNGWTTLGEEIGSYIPILDTK